MSGGSGRELLLELGAQAWRGHAGRAIMIAEGHPCLLGLAAAPHTIPARPPCPPCCSEVRDPRFESLSAGQYDESKFKKR